MDLSSMVDLALGTKTNEIINLKILHELLHIIVRNLNTNTFSTKSEIIEITEEKGNKEEKLTEKTEIQIEELKTDSDIEEKFPPINIISHEDFRKLSDKVNSITDVLSSVIPNNKELISEEKDNTLKDLWNLINLAKRIDALEITVQKYSSIVCDLAKEYRKHEGIFNEYKLNLNIIREIKDRLDEIENKIFNAKDLKIIQEKRIPTKSTAELQDIKNKVMIDEKPQEFILNDPNIVEADAQIYKDINMLRKEILNIYLFLKDIGDSLEASNIIPTNVLSSLDHIDILNQFTPPSRSMANTTDIPVHIDDSLDSKSLASEKNKIKRDERKMKNFEAKILTMERKFDDMEKQFLQNDEKLNEIYKNLLSSEEQDLIKQLENKTENILKDIKYLKDQNESLLEHKVGSTQNVQLLNQKTEELSVIKVDKFELDEFLAEKADNTLLQKRVLYEDFETTKREINSNIQNIINKFAYNQNSFQEYSNEIQKILDNKLSKEEMAEEKLNILSYVNEKLDAMQKRIKSLRELYREPEAAGGKQKFLKNLNCVSCDQNVIMKTDEDTLVPKLNCYNPDNSLKPMLTYNISTVRKNLNKFHIESKNMKHLEEIFKSKGKSDKNIHDDVNGVLRYCGGSHTIITQQDQINSKNIMKNTINNQQCPPSLIITGVDGSLYKGN